MITLFFLSLDSLIQLGLYASYNADYESSNKYYHEIIKKYPAHPAGYFFKGALFETMMIDYATDRYEDSFYFYMGKAKKRAEEILKNHKEDKTALFYNGAVHAFTAIYEGWHKRYLPALRHGLKARWYFDKVIGIDPCFYDAYLLKGTYEYFAGRINRFLLGILPFGNVQKGIKLLRKTAKRGKYFDVTARQALCWVLTEEKRYQEAERVSKELIKKYPSGRIFLWQYGKLLIYQEKTTQAENFWRRFLARIKKEDKDSYNNIAEASYYLALALYKKGEKEESLKIIDEVIKNKKKIERDIGYMDIIREIEVLKKRIEKE